MADPTCVFPGCTKPPKTRKQPLCNAHYSQRRKGKPLTPLRVPQYICTLEGCARKVSTGGLCQSHAKRERMYGDPTLGGPVRAWGRPPEQVIVDNTERRGKCLIWTGATNATGYGTTYLNGKGMLAHTAAWVAAHGPVKPGVVIDHRYHCDPLCCEVEHLREASKSQNGSHRKGRDSDRTNGLPRNVSENGSGYAVRVTKDGAMRHFGTYRTVEEAAQVAERARREMFGEFAGHG